MCVKSGDLSSKKVWVHLHLLKPKSTLETLENTKLSLLRLVKVIIQISYLPSTRRRLMNARRG